VQHHYILHYVLIIVGELNDAKGVCLLNWIPSEKFKIFIGNYCMQSCTSCKCVWSYMCPWFPHIEWGFFHLNGVVLKSDANKTRYSQ